jgi:uncharacterized membrane protein
MNATMVDISILLVWVDSLCSVLVSWTALPASVVSMTALACQIVLLRLLVIEFGLRADKYMW